jgi:hypothetical protein
VEKEHKKRKKRIRVRIINCRNKREKTNKEKWRREEEFKVEE